MSHLCAGRAADASSPCTKQRTHGVHSMASLAHKLQTTACSDPASAVREAQKLLQAVCTPCCLKYGMMMQGLGQE